MKYEATITIHCDVCPATIEVSVDGGREDSRFRDEDLFDVAVEKAKEQSDWSLDRENQIVLCDDCTVRMSGTEPRELEDADAEY